MRRFLFVLAMDFGNYGNYGFWIIGKQFCFGINVYLENEQVGLC